MNDTEGSPGPARAFYSIARDEGFGPVVSALIMVIGCLIFYDARVRRAMAGTAEEMVNE